MSLGIRTRVFFVLLLATGAVAGGMYLFMQQAFERGFVDYVRQQEERRIDAIAERLEAYYAEAGGWRELRDNRRLWWRLLASSRAPVPPPPMRHDHEDDDDEAHHRPALPPPSDEALPFVLRISLLDLQHRFLIGGRDAGSAQELELRALHAGEVVIGYIGFRPERRLSDRLDRDFAAGQTRAFVIIALLAIVISGLLAFPFAHRFVRPLRDLQAATRRLSEGDYEVRAEIHGNDELGRLARDFNDLAMTLERTERQRRQWVADISHELRTPLAVLRGEIEALIDGVRKVTPETLASLHAESLHLGRLIGDLYELSMSDIGALSYRKANVDALASLRDVLQSLRPEFELADITVERTGLPDTAVDVFADADRLAQLYNNVLTNTLRYTDRGGRLRVAAAVHGRTLNIDFQDSTPGVPEAELERLFDRLYRVEASRNRASGGAGLGLAISANIVAAHEGRIEAKASPLGGVWIHIELPLPPI
ncbi:MAG: HAMP domain-containing protein [Gammaproteobacteria bacterium]|nr:HAMP domain-containing protein [Gammaproteobacteria bacterium]MCP5137060.1 HAMP domain-containing protein [Gammaproteobacteria bacterium]